MKKPNMIVWLDDRHQLLSYLTLIEKHGLKFYQLIWDKTNSATPFNCIYLKDKEVALYIYDKPVDYKPTEFSSRYTIIKENGRSNSGNKEAYVKWHPTPKPLPIITKMIEKHTAPDQIVLDIFSGSGTTAVAAHNTGRQFIAIELDKTYYEKSVERLESITSQNTFNFGD